MMRGWGKGRHFDGLGGLVVVGLPSGRCLVVACHF